MSALQPPTLEQFLGAPIESVRAVAPQTVIYGPGGTRRAAALAGISPQSDSYASWTWARMAESIAALVHVGVSHIVMNLLRPAQMAEVGRYRDRLLAWLAEGLAGEEAIAEWQHRGWRMRMIGLEDLPELHPAAERLVMETSAQGSPTVWWYLCPNERTPWASLVAAISQGSATSQAEAIRAVYGEAIPPATLYLAFGKPIIAADIIPPLLAGELQCYWTQRPGFSLDEDMLRRVLYDYAYLRRTWSQHKAGRYEALLEQRHLWEQRRVIGLGERHGPFWYPLDDSAHTTGA